MSYLAPFPSYCGVLVNIAFDSSASILLPRSGWSFELWTDNFGLQKLETQFYRAVHKILRYTEPFWRAWTAGVKDGKTDRRTDGQNYDSNSVR